jgi:hypothetical protein
MFSQSLADDMVSVSKLCCPVCWELFQVLQKEGIIRGCHPTVTPTVLPEMLPEYICEAMVTRFRAHLSNQLRNMYTGQTARHYRNSSDSAYSVSSSNEGKATSFDKDMWLSAFK